MFVPQSELGSNYVLVSNFMDYMITPVTRFTRTVM